MDLLMKFNLHVVNEFKMQQLMTSSVSKHFLTLHSLFADDDIITSTYLTFQSDFAQNHTSEDKRNGVRKTRWPQQRTGFNECK